MIMNLAIYDKAGGGFSDKATLAGQAVFTGSQVTKINAKANPNTDCLRVFSCVVCHLNSLKEEDPSWPNFIAGDLKQINVVIRVSSQGAGGMSDSFKPPYRHNGTGPWILHLIDRSGKVTEVKWREIFKAVRDWDITKDQLPNDVAMIFDPHPEFRLALRLLCEAWKFTGGKKERIHGEITVHAPMSAADWFTPFGKNDPTVTDANQIGDLMRGAERQANELLKAVVVPNSGDDLTSLVEALLCKLQELKQPS